MTLKRSLVQVQACAPSGKWYNIGMAEASQPTAEHTIPSYKYKIASSIALIAFAGAMIHPNRYSSSYEVQTVVDKYEKSAQHPGITGTFNVTVDPDPPPLVKLFSIFGAKAYKATVGQTNAGMITDHFYTAVVEDCTHTKQEVNCTTEYIPVDFPTYSVLKIGEQINK